MLVWLLLFGAGVNARSTYFLQPPAVSSVSTSGLDVSVSVNISEIPHENVTFPFSVSVRCCVLSVLSPPALLQALINITAEDFWNPFQFSEVVCATDAQHVSSWTPAHSNLGVKIPPRAGNVVLIKCATVITPTEGDPFFGKPALAATPLVALHPSLPSLENQMPGVTACYEGLRVWSTPANWSFVPTHDWQSMTLASGRTPTDFGDYSGCQFISGATFCTSSAMFVAYTGYCVPDVCTTKNAQTSFLALRSSQLISTALPQVVASQALVDRRDIETEIARMINATDAQMRQIDQALILLLGGAILQTTSQTMEDAINLGIAGSTVFTCGTHHTTPPKEMWVYVAVMVIVALFAIACTVLDWHWTKQHLTASLDMATPPAKENEGVSAERGDWESGKYGWLIKAWSLERNWSSLVSVRPGALQFFDGIRVFACCWVIYGHGVSQLFFGRLGNPSTVLPINGHAEYNTFFFQIIQGGLYAVDTFLWVGGFFATFVMLGKARKMKQNAFLSSIPLIWVNRYLRVLPCVLFALGAYWYVLPNVGSGPWWGFGDDNVNKQCSANWWAEVFFLTSWSRDWQGCLAVTWYISCDLFLFACTPVFVFVHTFVSRKLSVGLVILTMIGITANFFYLAHKYKLRAPLIYQVAGLGFSKTYFTPLTRGNPYLVGVLLGMFYDQVTTQSKKDGKKWTVGEWQSIVLQAMGLLIVTLCVFGLYDNTRHATCVGCPEADPWTQTQTDMYTVLSRLGFGVGLTCFAIPWIWGPEVCFARWLLTRPVMSPLGKLTFVAYLAHMFFVNWFSSALVVPFYFSYYNSIVCVGGIVMCAFTVALVGYLLVELPFGNMQTHLFSQLERRLAGSKSSKESIKP